MDLDRTEYQHIKNLQDHEKQEAEDVLYKSIETWSSKQKKAEDEGSYIFNDEECDQNIKKDDIGIPPIRGASCMRFQHTPRVFKTPVRESTVSREMEFLLKNRPYLNNNKYFNNDSTTNVSEMNPIWLKQKGDDFFRGGDYLSAINAYSEAFEKDAHLVQALSNRSLCYLNLGEIQRCICDGEEALRIVESIIQLSLSASEKKIFKKKILTRLATAHFQMSHEGLHNCEIALKHLNQALSIDKSDEFLQRDINRGNLLFDALKLKSQGDKFLANEQVDDAITIYKKASLKESSLLCAKVNCASAHLIKGDLEECIELCGDVLDILKMTGSTNHHFPIGTIPFPGTDRRRQMVIATLVKRAEAERANERTVNGCIQDLEMARSICRYLDNGADIESDIIRVKEEILSSQ